MRGWGMLMLVAAPLATLGCDASGSGPAAETPDAFVSSELTPWSPNQAGTTKAPAYGDGCRLGADDVFTSAPNAAADDELALQANAAGAALSLRVYDDSGLVLDVAADLERALVDKVYRRASGTAALGGQPVTIVDGTLCFPERLQAGAGTAAEFSLVFQLAGGGYRSVSGRFDVPGSAVTTDPSTAVNAQAIVVDLR